MPRFHCADAPARAAQSLALPPGAARHVQVLRLQPGDALTLFDGRGGEYEAARRAHGPQRGARCRSARTTPSSAKRARAVHLAVGMPANERMDWLVEKATELGVASIQPLLAERSVLRLAGERAREEAGALAGRRDRRLRAVRPQPRAAGASGAAAAATGWRRRGAAAAACCRCAPARSRCARARRRPAPVHAAVRARKAG